MKLLLLIAIASLLSCNSQKNEPAITSDNLTDTIEAPVQESRQSIEEMFTDIQNYYKGRESMAIFIREKYPKAFRQYENGYFKQSFVDEARHVDFTLYDRMYQYNINQDLVQETIEKIKLRMDMAPGTNSEIYLKRLDSLAKVFN